jgi:hypothetical protein
MAFCIGERRALADYHGGGHPMLGRLG